MFFSCVQCEQNNHCGPNQTCNEEYVCESNDAPVVSPTQSSCLADIMCDEEKPFCNNDYKCVQCELASDCGPYQTCKDYECVSADADEAPGVNNLQLGYNLYKANPFHTNPKAIDPGIKWQIFKLVYKRNGNTFSGSDGKTYDTPLGYQMTPSGICKMKVHSNEITSTKAFDAEFSFGASNEANGIYNGVSVGASSAMTAYMSVYKSVQEHKKTVNAESTCPRLVAEMMPNLDDGNKVIPHKLTLTNEARDRLEKLSSSYDPAWKQFFDDYGTHIVTKGVIGASMRASYTFTGSEVNKVIQGGFSFSQSVSIGISELFGASSTRGGSAHVGAAKAIKESSGYHEVVTIGDVDEPAEDMLIARTLGSFCSWVDYKSEEKLQFNEDNCLKNTEKYCIEVMKSQGIDNAKSCAIPSDKKFDCVIDSDCSGDKRCWNHKCVNAQWPHNCKAMTHTSYKHAGCGRRCPNPYKGVGRYDNRNCYWPSKNNICEKTFVYTYSCYPNKPYIGGAYLNSGGFGEVGCIYKKSNNGGLGKVHVKKVDNVPSREDCIRILTQDPIS